MNNPKETGNNIIHAVRVLKESYNGIAKLITACNYLTDAKQTDYIVLKNGMICCRTSPVATVAPEKQCASWLIQSFWLFYKHNNHADEVYLLNINMDENSGKPVWKTDNELPEDAEIPVICMAKIAYENAMDVLNYINSGSGTTTRRQELHEVFTAVLYGSEDLLEETIEPTDWGCKYIVRRSVKNGEPLQDKSKARNGLTSVIYTAIPLMDVTGDNLKEKVFGTFDRLADI